MSEAEKKLVASLIAKTEEISALAALCARYEMALEAARACEYVPDAGRIVRIARKDESQPCGSL